MEKDKRLMEASLWDSMPEGETESCSDGWGHGNKSLIQFSDGPGYVPSLLFDLRPNYGGSNEDNVYLLQNVPGRHCYTQCPQPCSRPPMTHTSVGDSWTLMGKSGSFSCGVTAPFSWVLVHTRFCLCLLRSVSPVLWKSWRLYGGVNGDLLQEGLCHTQVCCTQSPCPCGRPLLTRTSSGDTWTQVCLSLCGVSGSCSAQSMFEPSEHLWQVWGLILKVILPLLPSRCGFSFALGHGVSPQSCSSTTQPQLQCLLACWGFSALGCAYLLTATAAPLRSLSWRSQRRPQDDGLW